MMINADPKELPVSVFENYKMVEQNATDATFLTQSKYKQIS